MVAGNANPAARSVAVMVRVCSGLMVVALTVVMQTKYINLKDGTQAIAGATVTMGIESMDITR